MAYNHGKEERKWRIWKENEEKILREYGVDESTIEEQNLIPTGGFTIGQMMLRSIWEKWQIPSRRQKYIPLKIC